MQQAWDKNGRIYYIDDNGNRVQPKTTKNAFERLGMQAKAGLGNLNRWLQNADTNSQSYKDKVNVALGLLTAPIGGSSALAAKGAGALTPFFGKKIAQSVASNAVGGATGGAVEGFGRGLVENKNPLQTMLQDSAIGLVGGGAIGGIVGKAGQVLAKRGLPNNPVAQKQYFADYVEGLSNNAPLGQVSRFNKGLADFRLAKEGTVKGGNSKEFLFAGENALNADINALTEAKEMFDNGIDNETIRQNTGWFKGVDGKWRYEIDDGNFNTDITWEHLNDTQEQAKLSDVYYNNELYDNYPDLKNIEVIRTPLKQHNMNGAVYIAQDNGEMGILLDDNLFNNSAYNIWKDKIDDIYKTPIGALSKKANRDYWNGKISDEEYNKIEKDFKNSDQGKLFDYLRQNQPEIDEQIESINKSGKKTLIHEIQHLLQEKEGFARGGDASTHPRYGHLAGEVEARLAEQRYDLSDLDKKNINPLSQFDVEPEKQIVRLGNDGLYQKLVDNDLKYRNEWVKIGGKDYQILNLPKKDYGKILHVLDTNIKIDDNIGDVMTRYDDKYAYTFQKTSPTDYKFIKRVKLK